MRKNTASIDVWLDQVRAGAPAGPLGHTHWGREEEPLQWDQGETYTF